MWLSGGGWCGERKTRWWVESGKGVSVFVSFARALQETSWILSNLTAGCADQIVPVWNAGLLPKLVEMVATEEYEIRKEAAVACYAPVL